MLWSDSHLPPLIIYLLLQYLIEPKESCDVHVVVHCLSSLEYTFATFFYQGYKLSLVGLHLRRRPSINSVNWEVDGLRSVN